MRRFRAALRKELVTSWASPVPYVVAMLFNAVAGVLFVDQLHAREQAVVQPLFPIAGFLVLALVPLVTMRTLAEERRLGTLELLEAVPVPPGPLVTAKFVASWLTSLAAIAPAGLLAGVVVLYGDPDRGPIAAGFLGLALLVGALTALGVLTSSLTSSQPVAAGAAFFSSLILWFAHVGSDSVTTGAVLAHLSFSERLRGFAGGAVDVADVGYLVAVTGATLVIAAATLHVRRLR